MIKQTCFAENAANLLLISVAITVDHVTVFYIEQRIINTHKINLLLDRRLRLFHCHYVVHNMSRTCYTFTSNCPM